MSLETCKAHGKTFVTHFQSKNTYSYLEELQPVWPDSLPMERGGGNLIKTLLANLCENMFIWEMLTNHLNYVLYQPLLCHNTNKYVNIYLVFNKINRVNFRIIYLFIYFKFTGEFFFYMTYNFFFSPPRVYMRSQT